MNFLSAQVFSWLVTLESKVKQDSAYEFQAYPLAKHLAQIEASACQWHFHS